MLNSSNANGEFCKLNFRMEKLYIASLAELSGEKESRHRQASNAHSKRQAVEQTTETAKGKLKELKRSLEVFHKRM